MNLLETASEVSSGKSWNWCSGHFYVNFLSVFSKLCFSIFRYGEEDPSLHLRSVYEGEATAPLKNHHLRQAPANPSVQERLSHNNNWHKKQYSGPRSKNQQQHLGGGGSRAPRVLQSSDSPSIGGMSYNNDPYGCHTLVGQHGIITRSTSLDHQHHRHSSHNSHSKFNLIQSANRQSKYVDKLNVGRGIQFYFS